MVGCGRWSAHCPGGGPNWLDRWLLFCRLRNAPSTTVGAACGCDPAGAAEAARLSPVGTVAAFVARQASPYPAPPVRGRARALRETRLATGAIRCTASDGATRRRPHPASPAKRGGMFVPCEGAIRNSRDWTRLRVGRRGVAPAQPPPQSGEECSCRAMVQSGTRAIGRGFGWGDAASPHPASPASGGGVFVPCGRRLEDRRSSVAGWWLRTLRFSGAEPAVSRVLSWTVIPLGAASPRRSSSLPGPDAGNVKRSLFGLAPGGVCRAGLLPGSRCALTAPFHPCHALRKAVRRFLSVALSVGSRRPGVTWHRALWSPDFPRHACA